MTMACIGLVQVQGNISRYGYILTFPSQAFNDFVGPVATNRILA